MPNDSFYGCMAAVGGALLLQFHDDVSDEEAVHRLMLHLFTPWLDHIKADYGGEYPAYPRRAFDLAVDRCVASMKKEDKNKPLTGIAAD